MRLSGISLLTDLILSHAREYRKHNFDEIAKRDCKPLKGDVLFSKDGTIGITYVSKGEKNIVLLSSIAILRPNTHVDSYFLNYYLRNKKTQNLLKGTHVSGSALPRIVLKELKKLKVILPSIKEQTAIAKIVSDFDSAIGLNQRINNTLEAIGEAVFKRWFVDFEFPTEEGKPYKSSNGEMVYNEELKTEIPIDWQVLALDEIADFTRGFSYSGSEKSKSNGDLVFVTLNSICEGGGFKREFSYLTSSRLKERHLVKEGDLILANTHFGVGGSTNARILGTPALVEFPSNYGKKIGCYSHHITKVTPFNDKMRYYLYYYLQFNQPKAVEYKTGSFIWALDVKGFIQNERIIIPNSKVLNIFSELSDVIFHSKVLNNKQSMSLSNMRDALLPKLMSGKIRVPINNKMVSQ